MMGNLVRIEGACAAFGNSRPEHTGEFNKNIQNTVPFYQQLLQTGFLINQNP
jgi:hypothetical protein